MLLAQGESIGWTCVEKLVGFLGLDSLSPDSLYNQPVKSFGRNIIVLMKNLSVGTQ